MCCASLPQSHYGCRRGRSSPSHNRYSPLHGRQSRSPILSEMRRLNIEVNPQQLPDTSISASHNAPLRPSRHEHTVMTSVVNRAQAQSLFAGPAVMDSSRPRPALSSFHASHNAPVFDSARALAPESGDIAGVLADVFDVAQPMNPGVSMSSMHNNSQVQPSTNANDPPIAAALAAEQCGCVKREQTNREHVPFPLPGRALRVANEARPIMCFSYGEAASKRVFRSRIYDLQAREGRALDKAKALEQQLLAQHQQHLRIQAGSVRKESQLETLRRVNQKDRQQIKELQQQLHERDVLVGQLRRDINAKDQEAIDVNARISALLASGLSDSDLTRTIEQLNSELSRRNGAYEDARAAVAQLRTDYGAETDKVVQLQLLNDGLSSRVIDLRAKLDTKALEVQSVQSVLQFKHDELVQIRAELQAEVASREGFHQLLHHALWLTSNHLDEQWSVCHELWDDDEDFAALKPGVLSLNRSIIPLREILDSCYVPGAHYTKPIRLNASDLAKWVRKLQRGYSRDVIRIRERRLAQHRAEQEDAELEEEDEDDDIDVEDGNEAYTADDAESEPEHEGDEGSPKV